MVTKEFIDYIIFKSTKKERTQPHFGGGGFLYSAKNELANFCKFKSPEVLVNGIICISSVVGIKLFAIMHDHFLAT